MPSPVPCLKVEANNHVFNILGIVHDSPEFIRYSIDRTWRGTVYTIELEQNQRFLDQRAQADLEAVTDTLTVNKLVFSEDNLDIHLSDCDYPEYGELLIPLNDHDAIFAAQLPEAALCDNPYLSGFATGFLPLRPFVEVPQLNVWNDIIKEESERDKFSTDPATLLFTELSPDKSTPQFCQIVSRLPEEMVYTSSKLEVSGLSCSPPIGIAAELERDNSLAVSLSRFRSALMALTLLRLDIPEDAGRDITVLCGRAHAAEIGYFLKHPPEDPKLVKMAVQNAAKINEYLSNSDFDLGGYFSSDQESRFIEFRQGVRDGILVMSLLTMTGAMFLSFRITRWLRRRQATPNSAHQTTQTQVVVVEDHQDGTAQSNP